MERKGEGSRGALGGESVSSLARNAATDNGAAEGGPQRYLDADLLEASPRPHWWSAAFTKDTSVPPARDAEQDGSRRQYLDTDGPQVRGRVQDTTPESSAVSHSLLDEVDIGFLTIQEKGVSAFSFDPDYESNASVFVEARTEITFLADGGGMAPEEGGGSCVQSNLPLPKLNEVYYWEAKMFTLPTGTNIGLGLATKPYPSFRLPGWSKFSVGYFSQDGFKSHNYPFTAQSYGPAYVQGDVIGVGYRPRSGTVFFTRNGKKLEDAFVGLNRHNLFPTVGADGAAEVHVNLGQAGFVFIEANVKKWGLAPMVGTLAPPPALHQLPPHQLAADGNMPEAGSAHGEGLLASYFPRPGSRSGSTRLGNDGRRGSDRSPSPPPYPGASDGGSVGTWSDESVHRRQHQPRSLAGRTSSIANAFMGALADRGLLAPLPGSPNVEDPNVRDSERHRILDVTTARNTDANRRGNDVAAERPGTAQSVTTWVESWFRS
ncbi:SPRY domain-containing proteins [Ceraceosorus bombacis]|uniref:SPRY domain-containing proteins n=1 Tax=Ceraceosorus bombacis TaxID=401625 RepID=A0A0P1BDP6_9BASI|nr:SPRY domain-containing proteins [Ceraceosorus bombacis]